MTSSRMLHSLCSQRVLMKIHWMHGPTILMLKKETANKRCSHFLPPEEADTLWVKDKYDVGLITKPEPVATLSQPQYRQRAQNSAHIRAVIIFFLWLIC